MVALSEMLRAELIGYGVPRHKTHVIRHGIDPQCFTAGLQRKESRRKLDLPHDRPIVGYIGGFQALGMEKGIRELVESIGRLSPIHGCDPLLVCVGGPLTLETKYRDFADRAGVPQTRLLFVDRVPHAQVPYWANAFDVAAIPFPATSHYQVVSPLKLVEYLAAGCCVMATNLPSIREEVDHGRDAWLVPPGVAGMVTGLDRLMRDPHLRDQLARNGQRRAAQRTWCARGTAILELVPSARSRSSRRSDQVGAPHLDGPRDRET
jgi:glycosyltransferase involved in cell wall biosynthesis